MENLIKLPFQMVEKIKEFDLEVISTEDSIKIANWSIIYADLKYSKKSKWNNWLMLKELENDIYNNYLSCSKHELSTDIQINMIKELWQSILNLWYLEEYNIWDIVDVWLYAKQPQNEHNNKLLATSMIIAKRVFNENMHGEDRYTYLVWTWASTPWYWIQTVKWKWNHLLTPID